MTDSDNKNNDEDNKVVKMPTLAERDRIAREKKKAEEDAKKRKKWNITYKRSSWGSGDGSKVGPTSSGNAGFKAHEPFFKFGNIPSFTKIILAGMIIPFLIFNLLISKPALWDVYQTLSFIPGKFTGQVPMSSLISLLSPITHMFLHSGWMHVIFNTIMFLAFGTFVEKRLGAGSTSFLYFASGIAGAVFFMMLHWGSDYQLLGASGGISGLFGVCILMMDAERRFDAITPMARGRGPWPIIGLWAIIMVLFGVLGGENIAWQAHLAGFLSGVGLYRLMQKGILRL